MINDENKIKYIGEILKELRKERGLSLDEVATQLKIDVEDLNKLEHGDTTAFNDISLLNENMYVYSNYLGLDYEYLVESYDQYLAQASVDSSKGISTSSASIPSSSNQVDTGDLNGIDTTLLKPEGTAFNFNESDFSESKSKAESAAADMTSAISSAHSAQAVGAPDGDVSSMLADAVYSADAVDERISNLTSTFDKWLEILYNYINDRFKAVFQLSSMSSGDLVALSEEYMDRVLKLYGNNYTGRQALFTTTNDPLRDLVKAGMPKDVAENLSTIMCEVVADKSYSREGVAAAAYLFVGILASYGLKLQYELGGSFYGKRDFFFGSGDYRVGTLDCINWAQLLLKSIGIDLPSGDWYRYSQYSDIPEDQVRAPYGSDYYTKGRPGDILTRGTPEEAQTHIMVIIGYMEDDAGNIIGYRYTEEADGCCIQDKTFKELGKLGYCVTNMDPVYNNTSTWLEGSTTARINQIPGHTGRDGNNLFIPPEAYKEVMPNLSDEALAKLRENFQKNNKWKEIVPYEIKNEPGYGRTSWRPPVVPKPVEQGGVMVETIFPENSYSEYIPPLSTGTVHYMEISNSNLTYEVRGVTREIFDEYILTFEEAGYKLSEDGMYWVNGDYALSLEMIDDQAMRIYVSRNNANSTLR